MGKYQNLLLNGLYLYNRKAHWKYIGANMIPNYYPTQIFLYDRYNMARECHVAILAKDHL
jgi:hypothetical protein